MEVDTGHPDASPERLLALVAAVQGFPQGNGHVQLNFANCRTPEGQAAENDRYARLIDGLDAMAWLDDYDDGIGYMLIGDPAAGTAWETFTVGILEVTGPHGFTPLHDRRELAGAWKVATRHGLQLTPTDALAEVVAFPPVVVPEPAVA